VRGPARARRLFAYGGYCQHTICKRGRVPGLREFGWTRVLRESRPPTRPSNAVAEVRGFDRLCHGMDCSWVRKGITLRVGAGMRGRPPLSSCNPCSAAPTLRHAPGLPLMFLILSHFFGAGALGEELVSVSGVLPPIIPKRIGLPSRPVDRCV
jgi:hypothetical protein